MAFEHIGQARRIKKSNQDTPDGVEGNNEIVHKDETRPGEKCGSGAWNMRSVTKESAIEFDSSKVIRTSDSSFTNMKTSRDPRSLTGRDVEVIDKAWMKKKSDNGVIPGMHTKSTASSKTAGKTKSPRRVASNLATPLPDEIPESERYEHYFQYKDKDDEEFGKKPRWFKRIRHYFSQMGCGTSNQIRTIEDQMPVVVFGATGMIGGAVVRALLKDHRFTVRAVTRTPTTDQARALAEEGAVVVPADLNDSRSLQRVMDGAAGVFLTTNYWEHQSKQKEITQGMNAIDAAVFCNVHHLVFQGSEPTSRDATPCGHMDAKAAIEEYIKETALPFTSIHNPFLYENLLSLFRPHCVKPGIYTVPIPMEDKPLDCMSLHDYARSVVNIFLRPKNHMMKSVKLTGDRMNVKHITDVLNRHFDDRKIIYHKISPKDYTEFEFQGCEDIAAMFEYLQTAPPRDHRITRRIHGSVMCFDRWVTDNKAKLIEAMKEEGEKTS